MMTHHHPSVMLSIVFVLICILCSIIQEAQAGLLSEQERVEHWHQKHTWPPQWHHESQSYRALMEEREREIMQLTGADERWENW